MGKTFYLLFDHSDEENKSNRADRGHSKRTEEFSEEAKCWELLSCGLSPF